MITFIDHIIKYSIDAAAEQHKIMMEAPSASLHESNSEFAFKLHQDSNAVASKYQMHSKTHNATCFKYGTKTTGQY